MTKKTSISFRLSSEARRLLKALSENLGISQAAVLEIVIREKARHEGVDKRPTD